MSEPRRFGGRYVLEDSLGRGGMADVHRARDEVLGRRVAVKVLRENPDDDQAAARFTAEVRTLAGLTHPHLVTVLDAGPNEAGTEQPFLVMELVEGRSLAAELGPHGALAPERVAEIGRALASALAYAHAQGVVHRDVKPANVLLGARVKLADFGIARIIGDTVRHTRTGQAVGTAAYLAPEQILGEEITPAADVYSLGLVLLESLTGSREYEGPATEAALARLHRQPVVPDTLSPAWRTALTAMTARGSAERPDATGAGRLLAAAAGEDMGAAGGVVPAADATAVLETGNGAAPAAPIAPAAAPHRVVGWWRGLDGDRRGLMIAIAALVLLVLVAWAASAAGGTTSDGTGSGGTGSGGKSPATTPASVSPTSSPSASPTPTASPRVTPTPVPSLAPTTAPTTAPPKAPPKPPKAPKPEKGKGSKGGKPKKP